jgi:hypothetical protein
MRLTPFEQTSLINLIAGNGEGDPTNPNWTAIESQLNLIKSELQEAFDNLALRNIEGLRDDVGDILFTGYGLGHRCGFPVDKDYQEVCDTNLSKFDQTMEDARKTQAKYTALGVETQVDFSEIRDPNGVKQTYYVVKSKRDQSGSDGKRYPAGKYLKSFNWSEPCYTNDDHLAQLGAVLMRILPLSDHGCRLESYDSMDVPPSEAVDITFQPQIAHCGTLKMRFRLIQTGLFETDRDLLRAVVKLAFDSVKKSGFRYLVVFPDIEFFTYNVNDATFTSTQRWHHDFNEGWVTQPLTPFEVVVDPA